MIDARRADCSAVASISGRRTPPTGKPTSLRASLHENGVRGFEQAVHKRQKRFVGSPCLVPLAFGALRDEVLHALGRDVAGGRDDTRTAEAHDVIGCGGVAGIYAEALGGGSSDGRIDCSLHGRLLHGDDVLAIVGEAQRGLSFHVDNAAARRCCRGWWGAPPHSQWS